MEKNFLHNSCTVSQTQTKCFDLLSAEELQEIEENLVEVSYKKGETIAKQGSFAAYIICLSKGLVRIYIENFKETLILKILSSGNLIGLPSLFKENNVFPYSVIAYEDSSAKLIDINVFRKIIKNNSKFAFKIIEILSANTIQLYGRFFCFEKKQSYGRLADIILCLSGFIYKSKKFELLLSRKELAELAGMSTESVIRIMKKFKDEGLISENGKTVTIINYDLLSTISQHG